MDIISKMCLQMFEIKSFDYFVFLIDNDISRSLKKMFEIKNVWN